MSCLFQARPLVGISGLEGASEHLFFVVLFIVLMGACPDYYLDILPSLRPAFKQTLNFGSLFALKNVT